jgi:hypothetical protein
VFPYPDGIDAKSQESSLGDSVPFPVAREFRRPKLTVVLGQMTALRAPMPETTIDEHGQPLHRKKEIWIPRQELLMHSPSVYSCSDEGKTKPKLGRSIARSPNCAHLTGADFRHPGEFAAAQFISKISFHEVDLCASIAKRPGANRSVARTVNV